VIRHIANSPCSLFWGIQFPKKKVVKAVLEEIPKMAPDLSKATVVFAAQHRCLASRSRRRAILEFRQFTSHCTSGRFGANLSPPPRDGRLDPQAAVPGWLARIDG
jgi:hypothetical protein